MSCDLHDLAKRFAAGELSAGDFADMFMERWKTERDDGTLLNDKDALSECLSSIFCIADLYDPDDRTRGSYELDAAQLCERVKSILERLRE